MVAAAPSVLFCDQSAFTEGQAISNTDVLLLRLQRRQVNLHDVVRRWLRFELASTGTQPIALKSDPK